MPIPLTVSEFREIEAELSELRYGGIPIGWTLREEPSETLRWLLCTPDFREALHPPTEKYIADFCGGFGRESARLIAETVGELVEQPLEPR